jgi:hypothetical protein
MSDAHDLEWLRSKWGDLVEDIRCDEGTWRGRWRSGDGRKFTAATADGVDAELARIAAACHGWRPPG